MRVYRLESYLNIIFFHNYDFFRVRVWLTQRLSKPLLNWSGFFVYIGK